MKMRREELERKVCRLETNVNNLRSQLIDARVMMNIHDPYSTRISLESLKDQINGIKNFLEIKHITRPAIPAKSIMISTKGTEED